MNQHKDYGKIVLDVIIKDENNNVCDRIKNVQIGDIDGLIKKYYNKEDLEEYINGWQIEIKVNEEKTYSRRRSQSGHE